MRPIYRGNSPITGDFPKYEDAKKDLVGGIDSPLGIGAYCSFCERHIPTNLAVEHIQAKSLPHYQHLEGRWTNFLLSCINCNSTKGAKDVKPDLYYLPDRDNTFAAFEYKQDGTVVPSASLTATQIVLAKRTLELTGLDKKSADFLDANDKLVPLDRHTQRMELWGIAERRRTALASHDTSMTRDLIACLAASSGGFSIWMKVFEHDADMRQRFINEFRGTAKDCFDTATNPVSPRPDNGLAHAGKI